VNSLLILVMMLKKYWSVNLPSSFLAGSALMVDSMPIKK
jgi:hypothetical protein